MSEDFNFTNINYVEIFKLHISELLINSISKIFIIKKISVKNTRLYKSVEFFVIN